MIATAEQLAREMATQVTTLDDLNGLMRTMMKTALERMLNTEMDVHLGRRTEPAATPDNQVLEQQGYLTGELILEDGRRLSFEIQDGAVGAQWNVLAGEAVKSTDQPASTGTGPGSTGWRSGRSTWRKSK